MSVRGGGEEEGRRGRGEGMQTKSVQVSFATHDSVASFTLCWAAIMVAQIR